MKPRLMYVEDKSGGLNGVGRIGWVTFSKTGRTLLYRGLEFQSLKGQGSKANYVELSSGDEYWISGRSATAATVFTGEGASRSTRTRARPTGGRSGDVRRIGGEASFGDRGR